MEENNNGGSFTLLKWNGKYGREAKFVVQNNKSGQQTMFTPGLTKDIVWTTAKLDTTPEIAKWQDFGNEVVDNLEDVAF